jgi:hypothetical protein
MPRKSIPVDQDELAYLRSLNPAYDAVSDHLSDLIEVRVLEIPLPVAFSVAFVQLFMGDQPNYALRGGQYGASRSNWTYHTALAISQASKLMDLTCKFETLGKRDAVIETKTEPPEVVLIAEWEWTSEDIFGSGKELEKLHISCRQNSGAAAFLLTYSTDSKYPDLLRRVTEYWIKAPRRKRKPPMLYMHTIIYRENGPLREFEQLRTADIDVECVQLWEDQEFA